MSIQRTSTTYRSPTLDSNNLGKWRITRVPSNELAFKNAVYLPPSAYRLVIRRWGAPFVQLGLLIYRTEPLHSLVSGQIGMNLLQRRDCLVEIDHLITLQRPALVLPHLSCVKLKVSSIGRRQNWDLKDVAEARNVAQTIMAKYKGQPLRLGQQFAALVNRQGHARLSPSACLCLVEGMDTEFGQEAECSESYGLMIGCEDFYPMVEHHFEQVGRKHFLHLKIWATVHHARCTEHGEWHLSVGDVESYSVDPQYHLRTLLINEIQTAHLNGPLHLRNVAFEKSLIHCAKSASYTRIVDMLPRAVRDLVFTFLACPSQFEIEEAARAKIKDSLIRQASESLLLHSPICMPTQGQCAECLSTLSSTTKCTFTNFVCKGCKLHLCISSQNPNCWDRWHSRVHCQYVMSNLKCK